jgi:hypothetical protein
MKIKIILFTLIILGCVKNEEYQNPYYTNCNIQISSLSESCQKIDNHENLTFGMDIQFNIELECGESYNGETVVFKVNEKLITQDTIIDLDPVYRSISCNCNEAIMVTKKYAITADSPLADIIKPGDEMIIGFYNARFLPSNPAWFSDPTPPGPYIPKTEFEIILKPEDFDCR